MQENPCNHGENQGCNQLAPLVAKPISECVHAGGDSEPPLAPFRGVQPATSPIGVAGCRLHPSEAGGNTPHTAGPVDSLAAPGVVRIALSERASLALSETGHECFAIIGRGSYPTDPARMVIYCQAVPTATATAACQILAGTHRAQRIKTPASATAKPAAIVACARVSERSPSATAGNHCATARTRPAAAARTQCHP